jgi:hypothetical protein
MLKPRRWALPQAISTEVTIWLGLISLVAGRIARAFLGSC